MLQEVEEIALAANRLSNEFEPAEVRAQRFEHDSCLHPRQLRSEAEVRPAGAERVMSVRISCYVEAVRRVEDGFVPIRGDHPQGRALTRSYELAVDLNALDRPTG